MKIFTKNLSKIIISSLIIVFFTGCFGPKQYGISVPSEKVFKKNSKTKFFIDKEATYKYEKEFLKNLSVDLQFAYIKSNTFYFYLQKSVKRADKNSYFGLNCYTNVNMCLPNTHDFIESIDDIRFSKKKTRFQFNSTVSNHSLIIEKEYKSQEEILADYAKIMKYIISTQKYIEKYGYATLYLDGEAFLNNKLVLKSILPHADFTPILKKQLKTRGFTLVDNPEDSDEIIILENPYLIKKKFINDVKRVQSDIALHNGFRGDAGSIGTIGMQAASFNGASSSGSAGVGIALFALSFLSGGVSEEEYFLDSWIINIIDKDNPSDYSQVVLRVESDTLSGRYTKLSYGIKESRAQSAAKFIEFGKPSYKRDKTIKISSKHKERILNK
jgi:hypothetical protein